MDRFPRREDFPDLAFICSNQNVVKCHRIMFGLVSRLDKDMFNWNDEETIISIPFASCREMETILDIVYTGKAEIHPHDLSILKTIFDCLQISMILEIENLISENIEILSEEAEDKIDANETVTDGAEAILEIDESLSVDDGSSVTFSTVEVNGAHRFACGFQECGKSFSRKHDLISHQRLHTGERPYTCHFCTDCFISLSEMRRHALKKHNLGEKVSCGKCGKTFRDSYNLKCHLKTHNGERDFQCAYCEASFALKSDLTKHAKVHTESELHTCNVCGKTFKWQNAMKRHLLTHSNEKPFPCDYCGSSFRQKCDLEKHARIHTKEKLFRCDICKKSFNRKDNLKKHQTDTHNINFKKLECPEPECKAKFNLSCYLHSHIKSAHESINYPNFNGEILEDVSDDFELNVVDENVETNSASHPTVDEKVAIVPSNGETIVRYIIEKNK